MWWKKILGILLFLLGAYLIFLEIAMAISEAGLFKNVTNIVLFVTFVLIGVGCIFLSLRFLR